MTFVGRLMIQQMPTKSRMNPMYVQKIVVVHPHAESPHHPVSENSLATSRE